MTVGKGRKKLAENQPGSVRIIAGAWRRTRIAIPATHGVRPSGDRVRETLFNWLAPYIPGARCLDLFAGSGVLAFEALSRGAAHASLLDSDSRVIKQLGETIQSLPNPATSVYHADSQSWLASNSPQRFDLIFLDPPFNSDLLEKTLELITPDWLADKALIYIETAEQIENLDLPQALEWTKRTQIGNVGIGLAARRAKAES